MKDIIARLRQFSTVSGVATLVFIGSLIGVESEVIKAGIGVLTAVIAMWDILRNEKK